MRVVSLIFVFLAFDWCGGVDAITNGNMSESKPKREDVGRSFNDLQEDPKLLHLNKDEESRGSRYRPHPDDVRIKDRIHVKDRDNAVSGSGHYGRHAYGFYPPTEDAAAGYGYQDFDQNPHYGPPAPPDRTPTYTRPQYDGGHDFFEYHDTKEYHNPPHHGYIQPNYGHDQHASALKGILLPLAGVALLGAAAALVTNPILLQLGVVSGRRRRRSIIQDIFKADQSNNTNTVPYLPSFMMTDDSATKNNSSEIKRFKKTTSLKIKKYELENKWKAKTIKDVKKSKQNPKSVQLEKIGIKEFKKRIDKTEDRKQRNDRFKRNTDATETMLRLEGNKINSNVFSRPKKDIHLADNANYLLVDTKDYDDVKPDGNSYQSLRAKRSPSFDYLYFN